jgi:hypothetical protein
MGFLGFPQVFCGFLRVLQELREKSPIYGEIGRTPRLDHGSTTQFAATTLVVSRQDNCGNGGDISPNTVMQFAV